MTVQVKGQHILQETVERYLLLLPEYQPEGMLQYLRSYPDEYPLELALQICREHQLYEAEAYLQQRIGGSVRALHLLLAALNEATGRLAVAVEERGAKWSDTNSAVVAALLKANGQNPHTDGYFCACCFLLYAL